MTENNERRLTTRDQTTDFLLYTAPDGQAKVECILHDETIWLTQKRIAELFGVGIPAISKHLTNIFNEGELVENSVVSILETTAQHGAIYLQAGIWNEKQLFPFWKQFNRMETGKQSDDSPTKRGSRGIV